MAQWPGTVVDDSEISATPVAPAATIPQAMPAQAPASFPGEEIAPEEVDRSTDLSAYAGVGAVPEQGVGELDPTGAGEFARPEDRAFAAEAQDLLVNGGTRAEFDALSRQYGYPLYGPDLDQAIAANGVGWRIGVPMGGHKKAGLLAPLANSNGGALAGAWADTGGAGLSDEVAGLVGGDSFMDVVRGEGEAQRQAQLLKDAAGEEYALPTAVGQFAGGVTGMLGAGKIAGAGRALAADTAFGAAYGAGSENENRLGGAVLGGAASAAGSYFGGKLLDKIANRAPSAAAKAVETAQKFGIDMPMGAMGRGRAIIEKGFDNLPGSAQVMQTGRDALSDQVSDAVENVADSFGPSTSFAGMGEALQTGAKKWIDKFQRVSGKAYEAIPVSPDAKASLTNTAATLQEMNGRFASNPKLAEAMKNTRLQRYMDALGEADAPLSWEDLKAFRTRIGEEIGDQRFSDGTMKSDLRGLYGALSEDMKNTAAAQGPAALRAFEKANNLYRQGQERIDGALVKILGDDSSLAPEKAAAAMQAISRAGKASSDLKRLAEIRKSMPAEEWGEVSNALIRLMGQPVNSEGRDFAAETFVRNFNDMAPGAKNLLFGKGELRANLDEFSGVVESLARVNALRNTSNTVPNMVGAGTISAALLNPIMGVKLAAGAAANYSLAKLWTNPRFVKWATGYTRMAKAAAASGGQPNVSKQLTLLQKVAAAEPAIAQDALGLQQYLAQQFNQVPGKLAAEERSQSVEPAP